MKQKSESKKQNSREIVIVSLLALLTGIAVLPATGIAFNSNELVFGIMPVSLALISFVIFLVLLLTIITYLTVIRDWTNNEEEVDL